MVDSAVQIGRAERTLAMAGQALDPNAAGGPDLELAKLLLARTLGSAAAATDSDANVVSASDAVATLERCGSLARAAGTAQRGRSILACLLGEETAAPERDNLVDIELLLHELLRVARSTAAISRVKRWRSWRFALLGAGGVAAAMVPTMARVWYHPPWARYTWTASSAASSYAFRTSGRLGDHGMHELVFHTALEDRPWVSIDLLETRWLHGLEILNRTDCCQERAVPLVVEVAGEDGHYAEVARRNETFAVWKPVFDNRRARYIRLWVDARTSFHLEEIRIP